MYSTCLFCNGSLGRNDALELFPVGRRVAFDAAKGRLWVVCPRCARWNLSPLDTRWEAIEEAERNYRNTRLRTSTGEIGLAKLREGTELVRIGRPLLPEFAAWRYADEFRKRLRRQYWLALPSLTFAGVSVAGVLTTLSGGATALGAASAATLAIVAANLANSAKEHQRDHKPKLAIRDEHSQLLHLSIADARQAELIDREDGEWSLSVPRRTIVSATGLRRLIGSKTVKIASVEPAHFEGESARRVLATLLPAINHFGGNDSDVSDAIDVVAANSNLAEAFLTKKDSGGRSYLAMSKLYLGVLPGPYRLALEMTLHEADERRALDGELRALEARWREAEEIASIADNLLMPPTMARPAVPVESSTPPA